MRRNARFSTLAVLLVCVALPVTRVHADCTPVVQATHNPDTAKVRIVINAGTPVCGFSQYDYTMVQYGIYRADGTIVAGLPTFYCAPPEPCSNDVYWNAACLASGSYEVIANAQCRKVVTDSNGKHPVCKIRRARAEEDFQSTTSQLSLRLSRVRTTSAWSLPAERATFRTPVMGPGSVAG